jgi:hypothetical protein
LAYFSPRKLHLNLLGNNPEDNINVLDSNDYFIVYYLPEYITYGKTLFAIGYENKGTPLKKKSKVLFEFKDRNGNIIYSSTTKYRGINGSSIGSVYIRDEFDERNRFDIKRGFSKIENGTGTMTIVGELDTKNTTNKSYIRHTIPIEIRKNLPNKSPVLFEKSPTVKISSKTVNDSTIARSGATVPSVIRTFNSMEFDNLNTVGGEIKYIQVYYKSDAYESETYNFQDTFTLTSSLEYLTKDERYIDSDRAGDFSITSMADYWSGSAVDTPFHAAISGSLRLLGEAEGKIYAFKQFRRTTDNEYYTLKYNISGSGRVLIQSIPDEMAFNPLLEDTLPEDGKFGVKYVYDRKFKDIKAHKDYVKYTEVNDVVDTNKSLIHDFRDAVHPTGSQMIEDDIMIPRDSNAYIFLKPETAGENVYFSNVSITQRKRKGLNVNTTYRDLEVQGMARREEFHKYQIKFLNAAGELVYDLNKPEQELITTASQEYFPEGFWIERGKGSGIIDEVDGTVTISLASRFTNVTPTGSDAVSVGTIGEASQGDDFEMMKRVFPGSGSTGNGNVIGGFFNAIRTGSQDSGLNRTVGISAQAYESGTMAAGGRDLWAGRFEHGNVYIKDKLGIGLAENIQLPSKDLHVIGGTRLDGDLELTGDISASGLLYTSASHGDPSKLLLAWDSGSGQVYYTSSLSFGGGGGGSGTVTSIVAGSGLNGGTITSAGTISVDSASIAPFFSSSMNSLTVAGDISSSGEIYLEPGPSKGIYFSENINYPRIRGTGNTSELYFYSNNSNVPLILSQSNVGIGTATPQKKLTVAGDISASGDLILENNKAILFTNTLDQLERNGLAWTNANYLSYGDSSLTAHQFTTNGGVRLFITGSTGNVGIGTTTPSKKLTVEGDISASDDVYVGGNQLFFAQQTTLRDHGSGLLILSGSTTQMVIHDTTGNVSIGETSDSGHKLYVKGDISASSDLHAERDMFVDRNATIGRKTMLGQDVTDSGKTLTVSGSISASGDLYIQDNQGIKFNNTDSTNDYLIRSHGGMLKYANPSAATIMIVSSSGVGIGSGIADTPKTLTVAGDISGSGAVYINNTEVISGSGQVLSGPNNDDTMIAIMPADFMHDNAAPSRGWHQYITDDGAGILHGNAGANAYAMKMIPKGFTATEVKVFCSATVSSGVEAFEGDITNSTSTSKGSGDTNAVIDITDVVGTGYNYIVVKFNPAATSNEIRGGYITIVRS